MLELLYRLYARDARSGGHRGTLLTALAVIAASLGLLIAVSGLPFREVHAAQGIIEPSRLELVRSEADGAIRQNQLRLGRTYLPGELVLAVASGASNGPPRVYTAPCRCVIARSDLLQRSAGIVRAGELIAELIDSTNLIARFPLDGRGLGAVAPGARVQVLDEQGTGLEGTVERVYPRRGEKLGIEAVASLPAGTALAVGSQVTIKVVTPPVPLWRYVVESLGRRKG